MGIRKYLKSGRVASYVIAGTWFIFGIVIALVVYFTGEDQSALEAFWEPNKRIVGVFGVLLGFVPLSTATFSFLAFTQETTSRYPHSAKRSAWYALAAAVLSAGIIIFPLTYFATERGLMEAIATLIPFFIPSLALLIFLLLTERDYRKPWVVARYEKELCASRELFNDPIATTRFGMVSGAIWIFAIGFFILLGLLIGFHFSWLVFVFAVAVQLMAQSMLLKPKA
jgi:hypothetical protein